MIINEEKLKKIALLSIFAFTFSGVVSLISVKFDNAILRIWKEVIILVVLMLAIANAFLRKNVPLTKLISFVLVLGPCFLLYLLFSINTNKLLVAYQIKNDIVPLLFVFSLYFILGIQSDRKDFYNSIIRLIVITAVINSMFIYMESMFPDSFMTLLQIEDLNNSGGKSGVRLDNALGGLRAMGTMVSFINSGTLTFFGIVCVLESGFYSFMKKIILVAVITSALIMTTYKTAMTALVIYFTIKAIYTIFKKLNGAKMIYLVATVFTFMIMAYVFNSFTVYNSLSSTEYKKVAYNSIYLRTLQHRDIVGEMEQNDSFYTGLGIGTHGTMGPDKKLKLTSKPLDSTYIYLMSNYGFIGTVLYVCTLFVLMLYFCMQNNRFDNISIVLLLYTLGVEFFINNIFANFPCNLIFYSVIFVSLSIGNKKNVSD